MKVGTGMSERRKALIGGLRRVLLALHWVVQIGLWAAAVAYVAVVLRMVGFARAYGDWAWMAAVVLFAGTLLPLVIHVGRLQWRNYEDAAKGEQG